MSSDDRPLPVGYQIDRYRIKSVLGRGGFGYTYLAEDHDRASLVAIKEHFPQQLARRRKDLFLEPVDQKQRFLFEQTLGNFRQEIRLLLRFPHPNLPYIHRVFDELGTGYFSMDFERGDTLEKWSRSIPVEQREEAIRGIVEAIGDALALLHRNHILHRDIKPDNLIVRRDGSPVLLDFGIAVDSLAMDEKSGRKQLRFVSSGYSPIEQYGHGRLGPWSDIYSLAATLYRIVANRRVVAADVRAKAKQNGRVDPLPSLRDIQPAGISDTLINAIESGLQIEPANRPQDLNSWRQQMPTGAAASDRNPAAAKAGITPSGEQKTTSLSSSNLAGGIRSASARAHGMGPITYGQLVWLLLGLLMTGFLVILALMLTDP